ncbi:Cysteine-rich transmembrane CYSTM domain-containing protein [Pleurotus pulmonarius]
MSSINATELSVPSKAMTVNSQPQAKMSMDVSQDDRKEATRMRGGGAGKDCCLGMIGCFLCFECCEGCCECVADIVCCPCEMCC